MENKVTMKMRETSTDHQALLDIQELMDGTNWTLETLSDVASILENAGYRVHDTDEDREGEEWSGGFAPNH